MLKRSSCQGGSWGNAPVDAEGTTWGRTKSNLAYGSVGLRPRLSRPTQVTGPAAIQAE
jgi:hypothetical protein